MEPGRAAAVGLARPVRWPNHEPKPGPVRELQISRAAGPARPGLARPGTARPVILSDNGRRPDPARDIFTLASRPGPAREVLQGP